MQAKTMGSTSGSTGGSMRGVLSGRGISIHLGLNAVDPQHYQGWDGRLRGCENDAHAMFDLAGRAGFEAQPPVLTGHATSERLRSLLADAASQLTAGDTLLLTYSGHGGQVGDTNNDEPDGIDETWCLFDRQVIDDELSTWYAGFAPGVRILVISDSCHSGTVVKFHRNLFETRGGGAPDPLDPSAREDLIPRCMPPEICDRVYRAHKAMYDMVLRGASTPSERDVRAAILLLSGCQDAQFSMDGPRYGAFTGTLLHVWNAARKPISWAALHRRILEKMSASQTPNLFLAGSAVPSMTDEDAFGVVIRIPSGSGSGSGSGGGRSQGSILDESPASMDGFVPASSDSEAGPGGSHRSARSGIPTSLSDLNYASTRTYDLSTTAAAQLNIPVAGSFSASGSARVVVLERAAWAVVTLPDGTEEQWGYAIRMCVTINKFDASLNLSLPFLAANAQIGTIRGEWLLQVVGLSGKNLDSVSKTPTELSVETFVLAKQSLEALIGAVHDAGTRFLPVRLAVKTPLHKQRSALRQAIGATIALDTIADRATATSIAARIADPEVKAAFEATLLEFAGVPTLGTPIPQTAVVEAQGLLGRVRISM